MAQAVEAERSRARFGQRAAVPAQDQWELMLEAAERQGSAESVALRVGCFGVAVATGAGRAGRAFAAVSNFLPAMISCRPPGLFSRLHISCAILN